MKQDLVSIVVPIYNAESYIENTVHSLLNQSYSKIEIILVNDGSKDNSLSVCRRLSEIDSRIKLYSQENSGVTRARAYGVEKACGEWITFVDSDDVLPEKAIDLLVRNSDNFDIVVGHVCYSIPEKWHYPVFSEKCSSFNALKYLFNNKLHSGPIAKLFKKELFMQDVFLLPRKINYGEDFIMNIRLFQKAFKVNIISDVVYNYIENPTSVTHKRSPFRNLRYCWLYDQIVLKSLSAQNRRRLFFLWTKLSAIHVKNFNKFLIKDALVRVKKLYDK